MLSYESSTEGGRNVRVEYVRMRNKAETDREMCRCSCWHQQWKKGQQAKESWCTLDVERDKDPSLESLKQHSPTDKSVRLLCCETKINLYCFKLWKFVIIAGTNGDLCFLWLLTFACLVWVTHANPWTWEVNNSCRLGGRWAESLRNTTTAGV